MSRAFRALRAVFFGGGGISGAWKKQLKMLSVRDLRPPRLPHRNMQFTHFFYNIQKKVHMTDAFSFT